MKLAVQAEVIKLAEELGCEPGALAFLERFEPDDLAELRHVLYHAIDERFRPTFKKLELAARLLPNPITVKIAMQFFSPMILGRTATELSVDKSLKLLPLIPTEFLADCSPYLDPERAKPMVAAMPIETMMPVVEEVVRRGDHVSMGRLLGALHLEHIPHVVTLVQDGRDLLLIGFHAEDTSVLDPILEHMTDDQITAVTQAAEEHDLAAEAEYILTHVNDEHRARLLDAASPAMRARLEE